VSEKRYRYDHERRSSAGYRAKKGIVRDLWLGAGLLMIVLPHPAAVCAVALATTFASFMILDETP
jgi:hypothetical protein